MRYDKSAKLRHFVSLFISLRVTSKIDDRPLFFFSFFLRPEGSCGTFSPEEGGNGRLRSGCKRKDQATCLFLGFPFFSGKRGKVVSSFFLFPRGTVKPSPRPARRWLVFLPSPPSSFSGGTAQTWGSVILLLFFFPFFRAWRQSDLFLFTLSRS